MKTFMLKHTWLHGGKHFIRGRAGWIPSETYILFIKDYRMPRPAGINDWLKTGMSTQKRVCTKYKVYSNKEMEIIKVEKL